MRSKDNKVLWVGEAKMLAVILAVILAVAILEHRGVNNPPV